METGEQVIPPDFKTMPRLKPLSMLYIFIAVLLFGTLFIFSDQVIYPNGPLRSVGYLFLRFLLASVALGCFLIAKGDGPDIITDFKENWKHLIPFTAVLHLVPLVIVFVATSYTSGANQTIINNMNLSFVVFNKLIFYKVKPAKTMLLAVTINFLGVLLVLFPLSFDENSNLVGDLIMVFAVFLGSFFPMFNRKFAYYHKPMVLSFFMNFIPMLVLIPFMFAFNQGQAIAMLTGKQLFFMTWIGVGVSGIAYGLGNAAYKTDENLTGEVYSTFTTLIPVIGLLLSYFLFDDPIGFVNLGGAILVTISLLLAVQSRKQREIAKK
ncbi:EamA family transporter [Candidatus Bathyarchaeota archaeon]|nr:EamA family transporter [Candidatus Bathyarchaeota archaeon]